MPEKINPPGTRTTVSRSRLAAKGYFSRSILGQTRGLRYPCSMTIQDELSVELKDALRTGDRNRKDVIRAIETEVSRAKSEPGFEGDVNDDLYNTVIASYVKKMAKARTEYETMGERGEEMAAKLAYETEYLARWMPQTLDEAATRALVLETITGLNVDDPKQAGKVVGHIMKDHSGEVDGGLVNRLVRDALGA